jgi:hypothetical protein
MSSATQIFREGLAASVAEQLHDGFVCQKERLERRNGDGWDVIIIGGHGKWSPFVTVDFYFGRRFDAAVAPERLIGIRRLQTHVGQLSLNVRNSMSDLPYAGPCWWDVNIRKRSPALASEVADAIRSVAYPFFERFRDILDARDALVSGDRWCLSEPQLWSPLLHLDAALNDLRHFESWCDHLDDFQRPHAKAALAQFREAMTK